MTITKSLSQRIRIIILISSIHSQTLYTKTGHLVVGDFKVNPINNQYFTELLDRTNLLGNELVSRLGQVEDDLQVILLLTGDLANHPEHTAFILAVFLDLTLSIRSKSNGASGGVVRSVKSQEDVIGIHIGFEVSTHLKNEFNLGLALLLHHGTDDERSTEAGGHTVVKSGELTLGRVEAEKTFALELVELHTLVEVHIIHDNEVIRSKSVTLGILDHRDGSVLADKKVLGHEHTDRRTTSKVGAHGDGAIDRLAQDITLEIYHDIQTLKYINI